MAYSFNTRRSPSQLLRSKAEVQREHRRTRYGVSQSAFNRMMLEQSSRCALCELEFDDTKAGAPMVDHSHDSGAVRSLLCRNCNTLLGRVADDREWLRRALAYLEAHNVVADA